MSVMTQVDANIDKKSFYEDLGGAILEQILRELRKDQVSQRELMAQVRSAKSHKVQKIAALISAAYKSSWKLPVY